MNIDDTVSALLGREGKYSNDPADKGGETMWGITVAVARAYGYMGAMADMSRETAADIYKKRYWSQPGFDKVNALAPTIAEELLDTGVNMGIGTAGKFLQRALNVLGDPDLTVDGNLGPMTLHALGDLLAQRGESGRVVLLRMLNAQQGVRYIELAEADKSQKRFEYGWQLNRVS